MEDTDKIENKFSRGYENSKQVLKEEYPRDKENEKIWKEMAEYSRKEKLTVRDGTLKDKKQEEQIKKIGANVTKILNKINN